MGVLEEALRQFRGTIVAVTHDREFIRSIRCSCVVEVRDGKAVSPPGCRDAARPVGSDPASAAATWV